MSVTVVHQYDTVTDNTREVAAASTVTAEQTYDLYRDAFVKAFGQTKGRVNNVSMPQKKYVHTMPQRVGRDPGVPRNVDLRAVALVVLAEKATVIVPAYSTTTLYPFVSLFDGVVGTTRRTVPPSQFDSGMTEMIQIGRCLAEAIEPFIAGRKVEALINQRLKDIAQKAPAHTVWVVPASDSSGTGI